MNDAILVTGATGFIGRDLVAALKRRGHRVEEHSSVVSDIAQSLPAFDGVRHVFHLAALTFVPKSWSASASFYAVNVQGTVNVMEFCRRQSASVTFLSSYVYGRPDALPISEDHPVRAVNPYGHTKILAEDVTRFYGQQFRIPVTIIRPFNVYGPDQDSRFLIPLLIDQAIDPASDVIKVADPRPKRDYLYIDDLVELLLLTFSRKAEGTFNAGSGRSISVEQLSTLIAQQAGCHKPIISQATERDNEILDVVADTSRAQREFGWCPNVSLQTGLRKVMNHRRSVQVQTQSR